MLWPLKLALTPGEPLPFARDIASQDSLLVGQTTMSPRPWSVIADTRSPAVFLPIDGEAAMVAVAHRYGVKWLLLVGDECGDASRAICRELVAGTRQQLGDLRAIKRRQQGEVVVFELQ